MSDWDAYITNLKGHCVGACDKAAIIGQDGSLWTTEFNGEGIVLTPEEAAIIGTAFSSKDFTPLQAKGIFIAGVKYNYLRDDDNLVLGKMKDQGSITLQSSKTAVVIGHTAEGQQQGNTNKGVAVIAEYLESLEM